MLTAMTEVVPAAGSFEEKPPATMKARSSLEDMGYTASHLDLLLRATEANHGLILVADRHEGRRTGIHPILKQLWSTPPTVWDFNAAFVDLPKDQFLSACRTGRVVLTLNASSALTTLERLADYGLTQTQMDQPPLIQALVYQDGMPRLCPHCSVPFWASLPPTERSWAFKTRIIEMLARMTDKTLDNLRLPHRGGCERCNVNGTCGEIFGVEVLPAGPALHELYATLSPISEGHCPPRAHAGDGRRRSGNMEGKTWLDHVFVTMVRGLVSPLDVDHHAGLERMRRS